MTTRKTIYAMLSSVALAGLWACPGGLEEPERFVCDGVGVADDPCIEKTLTLFQSSCATGGCHDSATRSSGLDLESPCISRRYQQKFAVHADCSDEYVMDSEDPTKSVLYKRVAGDTCGGPMPPSGDPLTADELDCILNWMAIQPRQ